MPRRQRALDPDGGPLTDFARDLRDLRARAGDPKFTTMARRTGRSKTALAEAAGGRRLPRWETVEDYVRACDGDPARWHDRWLAVRAAPGGRSGPPPDEPPPAPAPAAPAPESPSTGPRVRRRVPALAVAALALTIVAAAGGGFAAGRAAVAPAPWEVRQLHAIEIQNKVALGAEFLEEDSGPAYLSTRPVSYCARPSRGCKVPGTEVGSGTALVAHCTTRGQLMHNYNVAEQAALTNPNPHRVSSDLWYRAAFPDGRVGVISEVYLAEHSRGGLGLPDCGASAVPGGG